MRCVSFTLLIHPVKGPQLCPYTQVRLSLSPRYASLTLPIHPLRVPHFTPTPRHTSPNSPIHPVTCSLTLPVHPVACTPLYLYTPLRFNPEERGLSDAPSTPSRPENVGLRCGDQGGSEPKTHWGILLLDNVLPGVSHQLNPLGYGPQMGPKKGGSIWRLPKHAGLCWRNNFYEVVFPHVLHVEPYLSTTRLNVIGSACTPI